jgi:hypothetical protein
MVYLYTDPKGQPLMDSTAEQQKARQETMFQCLQTAVTVAIFRVGKHASGPFQGLFTLEKQYKGKWIPIKDGDLLTQVLDDVSLEVVRSLEDTAKATGPINAPKNSDAV